VTRLRWRTLVAIRVFLGLIFFTSGMGKLTHGAYESLIGPVWLIERLAPYGLGLWATFVAWAQVTIGLLLFSRRFSTLGAIMLVPLLANILMVTVSLGWRGTPIVNAFLLALNLVLLIADRRRLMFLISDDPPRHEPTYQPAIHVGRADLAWIAGLLLCVAAVLLFPVARTLTFVVSAAGLAIMAAAPWLSSAEREASVR
jgi:uncharacterized membrane protein YphA (DoxX/SURF4 family)